MLAECSEVLYRAKKTVHALMLLQQWRHWYGLLDVMITDCHSKGLMEGSTATLFLSA